MKEKVLVGMSGGVDSSVCVYLLQQQGYEVEGVFLHLWDDDEKCRRAGHVGCCGADAVEDARAVCSVLSIPLHVVSMKEEFLGRVVDSFCDSYLKGSTPNPCIECNRFIKWKGMMDTAARQKAGYVATGHYASVIRREDGRYALKRGGIKKDQTYVLYRLTQEQLSKTLFPLGEYDKAQIRSIAKEAGIPVAAKRDSQDVCFIPDGDHGAFIRDRMGSKAACEGEFVLTDGTVIGRHKGIYNYTYGQRKGLGVAYGEPLFVVGMDTTNNRVVLGRNEECYRDWLEAVKVNHVSQERFNEEKTYIAKIRYSDPGSRCHVEYVDEDAGRIRVNFERDYVAGGGMITL